MLRIVLGRLVTETALVHRYVKSTAVRRVLPEFMPGRTFTDVKDEVQQDFDASLLELLICPLSKKPLRFEAKTNELINEELGIAYPIIDGIPNMIPEEARLLQKDPSTTPAQQ